jgi:4-hydroxy 2-oxovalerate aldolase
MKHITINDVSLRDGNHSVNHLIELDSIARYCQFADKANIPIIEVGHGCGLSASSILIGECKYNDRKLLSVARENIKNNKLCIHIIPGFATVKKDIQVAIDEGVDVFRVATHCTEATLSKTHLTYLRNNNKTAYGVLMLTALTTKETLLEQSRIMLDYGAEAIILMDSTGSFLPIDVQERIELLVANLDVEIGFHAHNNLSLSIANSLQAAKSGATILDACINGFGAGAGNTPLEILVPVLHKSEFETGINFDDVIVESKHSLDYLVPKVPIPNSINILTGLYKIVGAFEKPIENAAKNFNVDYIELIKEVSRRQLIAGQEDLIIEIAESMSKK